MLGYHYAYWKEFEECNENLILTRNTGSTEPLFQTLNLIS